MEMIDLGDVFRESQFKVFRAIVDGGGCIKAINAKGAAAVLSKEQLKKWEEWVKTEFGAKGLAYIKWSVGGEWESPIVKFFGESEKAALAQRMDFVEGDVLFFGADKWEAVCAVLGRVRLRCAELLGLIAAAGDALNFLWVVDFPLLAFSPEDNQWVAVHHPFTRPKAEDMPLLEAGDYGKVRAVAYDVVLNGVELGGGSIRIHERDLQARMFAVLGVTEEEQQVKFGHLLRAFSFGASAWRHRAWIGSHGDADRRRGKHSRRDRLPEEQPGPGSHDAVARGGGFQAAARGLYPKHGEKGIAAWACAAACSRLCTRPLRGRPRSACDRGDQTAVWRGGANRRRVWSDC
jgi:aspartyl-tRNA synthetase